MEENSVRDPQEQLVKDATERAVLQLYQEADDLLADGAHERSLMFHVGRFLVPEVSAWNLGLRVDLEYNRSHDSVLGQIVQKTLPGSLNKPRRRVIPDLVVHKPSTKDFNLLVVEAKVRPKPKDRQVDSAKLLAMRNYLNYRFAVFVEFQATGPLFCWNDDLKSLLETGGPIGQDARTDRQ